MYPQTINLTSFSGFCTVQTLSPTSNCQILLINHSDQLGKNGRRIDVLNCMVTEDICHAGVRTEELDVRGSNALLIKYTFSNTLLLYKKYMSKSCLSLKTSIHHTNAYIRVLQLRKNGIVKLY